MCCLTLEQIKKIAVGVVDVWEEKGCFHFAKCTPKQVKAWHALEDVLGFRAETTTGVKLDFHTNSKIFAFTPQAKGTYDRYEVYVDNILKYYYKTSDFIDCNRKEIILDGKEHRITLCLPGHEIGVLEAVEVEENANIMPHTYDCKILFIGDSITQGWESTWDSLSYANNVSRFFNAESLIQGIGGAFYHDTTFDEGITFEPDIIVVAYGTNDWKYYSTVEEGREQCSHYLDMLIKRFPNSKIFGISPIWRGDKNDEPIMGSFESCCAYVQEEIKAHNMILIDGETLTPHLNEFLIEDVLHPDTCGFALMALNLIAQMQKKLTL